MAELRPVIITNNCSWQEKNKAPLNASKEKVFKKVPVCDDYWRYFYWNKRKHYTVDMVKCPLILELKCLSCLNLTIH